LDVASADLSPQVSTVEKDCVGFKTVTYRKTTTTGALTVMSVEHRRQPLIGVRNSVSLTNYFNETKVQVSFRFQI
jgi:hypothetical protein